MKKPVAIIIPIIIIIIIGAAAVSSMNGSEDMMDDDAMMDKDKMSDDTVTIGAILPLTGDLSTHGEESIISSRFGVSAFNNYLEEQGESWRLKIAVEDTATNPVIALEKLTSLHAKNIKVVVGPQSSAELRNVKGYGDANGLVMISPSSTSPTLAIPGDSIFRLIPDDTKQGPAVASLINHEGIKVIIPVWRGDTWGDGLTESTVSSFEELGGTVDEGVRYNPETPEFSASTSLLAEKVTNYVDEYGAENVGIVIFSFAEVLQFMQSASEHESLDDVRWFGGDGNTKEEKLIDDPIGKEFAGTVSFTTTQVALNNNPIYQSVQDHINDELGRTPNSYAYSSYDAAYIAGLAILESMNTGVEISDAIPNIAAEYSGAIGTTKLNEAGDLAQANYAVWGIRDGEWKELGLYNHVDGSVTLN